MRRLCSFLCVAAIGAAALPLEAQVQRIRASIRGGSEGKCTFEVVVDGIAEVEIFGDTGVLRTIQGGTATWRRLDCTQPLPNNPGDFRFKGIDGRGSQNLVRDPRSSGGVAVVRLEDPKGGTEGYTGDILWRGGESHWGSGGNWSGGGGSGWNDPWGGGGRGIDFRAATSICQNQVSRVRGVSPGDVRVFRKASQRDFEMGFSFRDRRNREHSGTCTVSMTGQLLNFNVSGGGWNDRIPLGQAMQVCEREVQSRLQVGPNNVRVQSGGDPGNGNFIINWQGRRKNGSIGTGQCIVAPNGSISDFKKWS